jgi:hypothetical protein
VYCVHALVVDDMFNHEKILVRHERRVAEILGSNQDDTAQDPFSRIRVVGDGIFMVRTS